MKMMLSFLMMLLGVGGAQTLGPSPTPTVTNDVRQSLEMFRGKIVILTFWATWCGPCRNEIPAYIALQNKYRDQGLQIVGVSIDPIAPRGNPAGAPAVAPFMKDNGINYHVWMVDNAAALEGYDVSQGIPTTYVLDRESRIVKKNVGARSFLIYEDEIKQLLSPQPKTECGPWDSRALGGNDLLYMRMINCVRSEGVKGILQHTLSPSGDRYVFVGGFLERWNLNRPPFGREKSDLWMVNIDGTGLQRLTTNGTSNDPEWSPDGNEIVFIDKGSINVLDTRSKEVRIIREAFVSSESDKDSDWVVYQQPKWSPNGKAIGVLARGVVHSDNSEGIARVEVITTDGGQFCHFARGVEHHQWNKEGELVLDYGKFSFDWEGIFSNKAQPQPNADKVEGVSEEAADRLRNTLLKRVSSFGVIRISNYSTDPSGHRIVFAGEFEGGTNHASPESDLWLVNRDGSGLRRLTENHRSCQPVLSPLGKEIAFVDGDSISVMDVKSRRVRRLPGLQGDSTKEIMASWGYLLPRWSPNGKVIAAMGVDEGPGWTKVVEARFGHEILEARFGTGRFEWNQEGELILGSDGKFVFDWDRTFWYGSWPRNQEPAESEQEGSAVTDPLLKHLLERVSTKGVKNIREYFPSPSGERLVFAGEFEDTFDAGRHESDLWLVNWDGSGLRRLTKNHRSFEPAWSPSGKQIAFVKVDSISIIDIKTGVVRNLAGLQTNKSEDYHERSAYGGPRWSPNGKAIAAEGGNGGTSWIRAVEARSGKTFFESESETNDCAWNDQSELILEGYEADFGGAPVAKVLFDWTALTNGARPASGRLFLFKQNGRFGYFDRNGETKIKPQFSDAGQFSEGLAPVAVDSRWGYINKTGELTIKPRFDAALPFSRGLARVKFDGRWRLIDKRGKYVR